MKALRFALCGLALAGCASNATKETGGTTGGIEDAGVKPSPNCPQGGGSMVEIPDTHGGSYCIDQNLVTNAAYAKWLDTNPSQDLRPAACRPESPFCSGCEDSGRSSIFYRYTPYDFGFEQSEEAGPYLGLQCGDTPSCPTPAPCALSVWPVPGSRQDYPVVNVSWCDAYVYCASHQKRLCGEVGGGPLEVSAPKNGFASLSDFAPSVTNPEVSEYFNALTRGGAQRFPYGDQYDPSLCPDSAYCASHDATARLHPVQSIPSCQGGFPGVFDLVGNAAEFLDACNIEIANVSYPGCLLGGVADEHGATDAWMRYPLTDSNTGFRCCADAAKP